MTHVLRPVARALTGSIYVVLGPDAVRAPGVRVAMAGPTLAAIRRVFPLPADDELVVRGNAAVQVVGGAMLALGILPRPASLAVIGSMVPTTLTGHARVLRGDPSRSRRNNQPAQSVRAGHGLPTTLGSGGGRAERRGR